MIKKNFLMLKYVFKFCPSVVIFSFLYIASSTIWSISQVYIIKDAIELVLESDSFDKTLLFNALLKYGIIVIITTFFSVFYNSYIIGRYRNVFIMKMQDHIFKLVPTIDMASFDDPDFYDKYSRALRDSAARGIRVYETFIRFLNSIVKTIVIGTVIITISDGYLVLIVLLSTLISIIFINKINRKYYKTSVLNQPNRRMWWYVDRTFYQQKYAAEIKTTTVSDVLINEYNRNSDIIKKNNYNAYKKIGIYQLGRTFSDTILQTGLTYVYLTYKLFKGMTVSVFTSNVNATFQFATNFQDAIVFLTELKDNTFYIDDFLWLVNYKPTIEKRIGKDVSEEFEILKINNVKFKYPDNNTYSLNGLNLTLKKGEKIAIVGLNGSGKTTLMKLLLKFYFPTEGQILFNNNNYNDYNEVSMRKNYAIVFQDFQIYAVTIGENVLMRKVITKQDEEIVWDALDKVGLKEKIQTFKDGIYTEVTREFDNSAAVFSGGEKQRLVIARVFASDASIYILDEPTSSLDPLSEEKINKLILKNATHKTMIIIAHRLSTVVDADKIYLIDEGIIKESGTHQEMMSYNGLYAKMFNTQKRLYQKHEEE